MANTAASIVKKMAIPLATLATVGTLSGKADAQVTMATAETVTSRDATYARGQLAGDLPAKFSYFGFMEIYQDGTYFGKSTVSHDLVSRLTGEVEVVHSGTPASFVAAGLGLKLPMRNGYAKIKILDFMPAWATGEQGAVTNEIMAAYGIATKIGKVNANSFGYYNLTKQKWSYGEIELTYDLGKHFEAGLNPMMTEDGFTPRVIFRIKK